MGRATDRPSTIVVCRDDVRSHPNARMDADYMRSPRTASGMKAPKQRRLSALKLGCVAMGLVAVTLLGLVLRPALLQQAEAKGVDDTNESVVRLCFGEPSELAHTAKEYIGKHGIVAFMDEYYNLVGTTHEATFSADNVALARALGLQRVSGMLPVTVPKQNPGTLRMPSLTAIVLRATWINLCPCSSVMCDETSAVLIVLSYPLGVAQKVGVFAYLDSCFVRFCIAWQREMAFENLFYASGIKATMLFFLSSILSL